MKKIILTVLLVFYIFIGIGEAKNEALCDKYIRLHILANSNSSFDQSVKIRVKKHLIDEFKNESVQFETKEETLNFVENNKKRIEESINNFLRENNIDYLCHIKISKDIYKKGNFKNINLPYGEYDCVKILLGDAKGKNLFFIMFPALSVKENLTVKADNTREIKYKSKILEILKGL